MEPKHQSTSAPWLPHYDANVPPTLAPYPDRTLVDYLTTAARERPRDPALLFTGATVTYAELDRLSNACAAAFDTLGVKRGDRVALLLPNCPQFLVAQFGAWKIGAIVAPLNPTYTERELEGPLCEHGIETIVTLTRFYARVKKVQAQTPLKCVIATSIKEYFPPGRRLVFTLLHEQRDGDRAALEPGDYRLAQLLRTHSGGQGDGAARRPTVLPDDAAVLLMSGGTTGTPKGVNGTHRAYVIAGLQTLAWVRSALPSQADVVFLPVPLFHVYGNVGVQGLAFVNGNPIALVPNPHDLSDVTTAIRRTKPAVFYGVPALYVALLNHPAVQQRTVDFKAIRICFSGAAPLLAETKRRFEAMTGGRIVEGYSLTEAMMATCVNPLNGPNKIGSVGMPLPDVHIGIFDSDTGVVPLPAGETGEVAISAPQLMTGYWNRPGETAGMLRDHADEHGTRRWLHTGDLGYLDQDGYLFIVDRKRDLIKTNGYQVWPREIEEVLAAHPAVVEVGVAGVHDDLRGEAVKAWVVLRPDQPAATEQDLRTFCREKLAPYKVPARIEFRAELPKTMVGKVLRRQLKEGG